MIVRLIFSSLAFSLMIASAMAQNFEMPSKGARVVGGSISFQWYEREYPTGSSNNSSIYEQKSFSFNPYAAKFIKERMLAGVKLISGWGSDNRVDEDTNYIRTVEGDTWQLGAGFFLRKYYPVIGKFGFQVQPGIDIQFRNTENHIVNLDKTTLEVFGESSRDLKGMSVAGDLNFGLYYFINEKISVEANFGSMGFFYSRDKESTEDLKYKTTGFNLRLINQLSLDQILVFNYFF